MLDVLRFPEAFIVKKKFDKERYLKHGNLTPGEKRNVEIFLKNTSLLYAIPCDDKSEMIVLLYEVDAATAGGRYWLTDLMMAIAQSFPYSCLLILRCEGVVKFFVFDKHRHTYHSGRSVVENAYATPFMGFLRERYELEKLTSVLRKALESRLSAIHLQEQWKNAIIESAGDARMARMNAYENGADLLFAVNVANEQERNFQKNEMLGVDDDDGLRQFAGDTVDEEIFIEFCASHCWRMYCEAKAHYYTEISSAEWMMDYLVACNECARNYFGLSIDQRIAGRILRAFEDREEPVDGYDVYDPHFLKTCLGKYFE